MNSQNIINNPGRQALFFVLGRERELCAQEVISYLTRNGIAHTVIAKDTAHGILLVDIDTHATPHIRHLGGTIKWGVILVSGARASFTPLFVANLLKERAQEHDITFGLRRMDKSAYESDVMMRHIKSLLDDYSVRFVPSDKLISSRTLKKNKLIELGTDFVAVGHGDMFFLGATKEVQDVDDYTRRDVGRPDRPLDTGIMPPKLAQIMINLAQVRDMDALLLDPFCGSGTILQEASLMGYTHLIGTDASAHALERARNNLHWAKLPEANYTLSHIEAHALNEEIIRKLTGAQGAPKKISAVITEPYLGPHLSTGIASYIEKATDDLSMLYQKSLSALAPLLADYARVVIIFPERRDKRGTSYMPHITTARMRLQEIGSFVHHRPSQTIARIIKIFEKLPE